MLREYEKVCERESSIKVGKISAEQVFESIKSEINIIIASIHFFTNLQ